MLETLLYLKAVGAAAIVSATIALAVATTQRLVNAKWLNSAYALAIGLGLATGYNVLSFGVSWPPASGLDRFLVIIVPAILTIEMIAGCQRMSNWGAWLLRLSLAAATPRILLHGSIYLRSSGAEWPQWQIGAVLTLSGAILAGLWILLSWLSERSPGISIPFSLGMATQCAGLTVMMAGYIKGGAAAFPLVATVFATTLGVRLIKKPSSDPANGAMPVLIGIGVVSLFSLLFIGRFFGRLSSGCALVIFVAPLMCWSTEWPLLRVRKSWLVESLRLLLVAIPLMVVLAAAKRDFDRKMAPLLGESNVSAFSISQPKRGVGILPVMRQ